jgi:hypothetical protein
MSAHAPGTGGTDAGRLRGLPRRVRPGWLTRRDDRSALDGILRGLCLGYATAMTMLEAGDQAPGSHLEGACRGPGAAGAS